MLSIDPILGHGWMRRVGWPMFRQPRAALERAVSISEPGIGTERPGS
jgi:hypothetical protein